MKLDYYWYGEDRVLVHGTRANEEPQSRVAAIARTEKFVQFPDLETRWVNADDLTHIGMLTADEADRVKNYPSQISISASLINSIPNPEAMAFNKVIAFLKDPSAVQGFASAAAKIAKFNDAIAGLRLNPHIDKAAISDLLEVLRDREAEK